MRTIRLYVPGHYAEGDTLSLNDEAVHYLVTVLRAKKGQTVEIFNGLGLSAQTVLHDVERRSASLSVGCISHMNRESPLSIHLGIGISKGDRFEWVLQKATELGVSDITPLWCERSQVKLDADRQEKKFRHWQQIIVSACEQSGRNVLPRLHPASKSDTWVTQCDSELKYVLDPAAAQPLTAQIQPRSVALLIGPEGGLTDLEITTAVQQHFHGLQIGPRILRTETAPLAALSILQFLWGDMA